MKFFAVFAAVLALAAAAPTTQWTMNDLSSALQNPSTPYALRPYLEAALNTLMEAAFSGQNVESVVVPTPAGLLPIEAISPVAVAPVGVVEAEATPALTTEWTINDLSSALQNPSTPYALRPYLEAALNSLMEAAFSGQNVNTVVVPTPAGLLPIEALSPVAVMPVGVVEAEEPVAPVVVAEPTPAVVADASGSPLVQIIVNIKSAEAAVPEAPANVVEESPILIPAPVIVVPEVPEPVIIAPSPVEVAPEVPEPIIIAPAPVPEVPVVIAPAPVEIAPPAPAPIEIAPVAPENPIDVIAIVAPENPIDVIAVVDTETNPIDLLQPVPVAVAAGESQGILV